MELAVIRRFCGMHIVCQRHLSFRRPKKQSPVKIKKMAIYSKLSLNFAKTVTLSESTSKHRKSKNNKKNKGSKHTPMSKMALVGRGSMVALTL